MNRPAPSSATLGYRNHGGNSCRELVSEYLTSSEERKKESNELRRLEENLKRIRVQYREGDIDRREYRRESARTKAALDATRVSVDDEVIRYGEHIEGLVEAWEAVTHCRNATNC